MEKPVEVEAIRAGLLAQILGEIEQAILCLQESISVPLAKGHLEKADKAIQNYLVL